MTQKHEKYTNLQISLGILMEVKCDNHSSIICDETVKKRKVIIITYFYFLFPQVHELTILPVGQNL